MRDDKADTFAIASLVLGIFSLGIWCLPCCCGTPFVPIAGVVCGILGLKGERRTLAIVGLVINAFGMLLIVVNMAYGAYAGMTGQNPIVNRWLEQQGLPVPGQAAPVTPGAPALPAAPTPPMPPSPPKL
jgi:hypothetical protein